MVFLENDTLRVEVLAGKGADITESGTSGSTRTCCTRVHTSGARPATGRSEDPMTCSRFSTTIPVAGRPSCPRPAGRRRRPAPRWRSTASLGGPLGRTYRDRGSSRTRDSARPSTAEPTRRSPPSRPTRSDRVRESAADQAPPGAWTAPRSTDTRASSPPGRPALAVADGIDYSASVDGKTDSGPTPGPVRTVCRLRAVGERDGYGSPSPPGPWHAGIVRGGRRCARLSRRRATPLAGWVPPSSPPWSDLSWQCANLSPA